MPIFINDYEWYQKDSVIVLKIELKKRKEKDVNIMFSSSYIKVNFAPYLFEAFLSYKIDPNGSSFKIKDGELQFSLTKARHEEWKTFAIKPPKNEAQKLRNEAMKEYQQLQTLKLQNKLEEKRELSHLVILKQIEINEAKLQTQKQMIKEEIKTFFIENKTEVSTQEQKQVKLRMRLSSSCSEEGSGIISEGDYDGDEDENAYHSSYENIPALALETRSTKKINSKTKEGEHSEVVPAPRQCSVLKMQHSTYKQGIPRRKSTAQLENKILKSDGKTENIDNEVMQESSEDIKKRAIMSFAKGDHAETVKLYSTLIELCPKHAAHYSNRAASYLALNLNDKTVKDCTKALSLLVPFSEENSKSRLLCLIRRGTAYVRLHNYQYGLDDYRAALLLDPENKSLAKDVTAISLFLNTSSDTGEEDIPDYSDDSDSSGIKENVAE